MFNIEQPTVFIGSKIGYRADPRTFRHLSDLSEKVLTVDRVLQRRYPEILLPLPRVWSLLRSPSRTPGCGEAGDAYGPDGPETIPAVVDARIHLTAC
jgi:hypothetical protein